MENEWKRGLEIKVTVDKKVFDFLFCYIILMLYFEIMINSPEVGKIVQRGPMFSFLLSPSGSMTFYARSNIASKPGV